MSQRALTKTMRMVLTAAGAVPSSTVSGRWTAVYVAAGGMDVFSPPGEPLGKPARHRRARDRFSRIAAELIATGLLTRHGTITESGTRTLASGWIAAA